MENTITASQWGFYEENGYLKLGPVLNPSDVEALCGRIDDIMMGRAEVDYDRLLMQLDGQTEQTLGSKGPTLGYRKIQNLEHDPLFCEYMARPLFHDICRRVYGGAPIACYRAMFMNKPARQGTFLPWHQDHWPVLDRDPLLTVWTALDPATVANGCVQVIPGSHRRLVNPDASSGFLTTEQAAEHCRPEEIVHLELAAGEAVLLHNWLLHASDVNTTDHARRAFSVCYMDARTRHRNGAEAFTTVFESNGA
jgi:hypothetical protein